MERTIKEGNIPFSKIEVRGIVTGIAGYNNMRFHSGKPQSVEVHLGSIKKAIPAIIPIRTTAIIPPLSQRGKFFQAIIRIKFSRLNSFLCALPSGGGWK